MDGAEASHRYSGAPQGGLVGRRRAWVEAGPQGPVDRVRMRILVGVTAKMGWNPIRRKGKGSSAMFVSRGLVGPKGFLNREIRKGSGLIFLHHMVFVQLLTYRDKPSRFICLREHHSPWRAVMARKGSKCDRRCTSSGLFPGAREKEAGATRVTVPRTDTGAPG